MDSLDKLEFLPGVVGNLRRLAAAELFQLVMVTNQDGLGTPAFPRDSFRKPQDWILKHLAAEGIRFKAVHIDSTLPGDNASTRKPGTGMLTRYFHKDYDLAGSFVVGDRLSDVELARNLGCRAVWFARDKRANRRRLEASGLARWCEMICADWDGVADHLLGLGRRHAEISRRTKETDISCSLNLDGTGVADINTGLPFLDHMLEQVSLHAGLDLRIRARGDLETGAHHTMEDCALVLGRTLRRALGDAAGTARYGFLLPMDDALARVALDLSGRPWLSWRVRFRSEMIGGIPTQMFEHFFRSFAFAASITLHIRGSGENDHHRVEAIFKALARALAQALRREGDCPRPPSTKGALV